MGYVDYDPKCTCSTCGKKDYEPCQTPCYECKHVTNKICRICIYTRNNIKESMCNLDKQMRGVPVKGATDKHT